VLAERGAKRRWGGPRFPTRCWAHALVRDAAFGRGLLEAEESDVREMWVIEPASSVFGRRREVFLLQEFKPLSSVRCDC